MVEGAPFRNPAASSDGSSYPFIDFVLPDRDALWPRPSASGRDILRNHIHYHHVHYSKDHLVSPVHIKNDGNNTPFFLIPVALMIAPTHLIFPLGVFTIQIITAATSFAAHVYLDRQYHVAGSLLLRFASFRRKQQLHFVHHKHGNSNFAIIDNFWDRLLGTYRNPEEDHAENPHRMADSDGQAKRSSAHSSALSNL